MSNEKQHSEAQRKLDIIICQPRQSLRPFQLIFTPSQDKRSDEYREEQWDWVEDSFTLRERL